MRISKLHENGFTLIEIIVTLLLVGISAALAGMWIVSVANGYLFAKMNMDNSQKAQLVMTRLAKEFTAIRTVEAAATDSITYTRANYDYATNTFGTLAGQTLTKNGSLLQLNGHTLADSVNAFTLSYCDNVTDTGCPATWTSTRRFIEITLTFQGADNIQSTFTQRIAPRNL
jgi:prepilin-type N-terminal cleavage/methylation domain-containing protein